MRIGSEWPQYANFPSKGKILRPTVKVFKTRACKKHLTACNGKPGKKSKAEFQNNRLFMVPLHQIGTPWSKFHTAPQTERNLGRRVGAPD